MSEQPKTYVDLGIRGAYPSAEQHDPVDPDVDWIDRRIETVENYTNVVDEAQRQEYLAKLREIRKRLVGNDL